MSTAQLHSIPAALERLDIGRSTLYELMNSGVLRSVKVGSRRLIPEAAIVEFIDGLSSASDANSADQGAA
ncbi:helix-turn-helix domain-containing protein [Nocardia sp. BMG51109]|uniref:helix-turn-helix domain-containing protein n=1 Tax=Nocardia sp. BMG51109 TaxID=1056816 RepID=UPI0004672AB5|nr:helix-turn-helix domain-containing protein [Nocardia sp. BMG51109]